VVELLLGCVVFLALMAALFVPLESFFPAHAAKPTPRAMAMGAGLLVLNTLLMDALGWPVLAMLNAAVGREVKASVVVVVFVFFASDLVGYWIHRAMHRVPLLWRFHSLHHEAHELSWLDAWRQHPVDFVLHGIAVGLPGALLGASLSEVMSVVLLRKAFTTFLHANVRVSFGVFGRVLASPEFHRVHHSADARDFDRHFAGTFPMWDVLFGTDRARGHQPAASDITNDAPPPSRSVTFTSPPCACATSRTR
jgi:sterol desaturase/sphingolipid hydroxylase (fatty acid hydroxylase superfamily)